MMTTVTRDWPRIESHIRTLDQRDEEGFESEVVVKRRTILLERLESYLRLLRIRKVLDAGTAGFTYEWWLEHGYEWHGMTFPKDAAKLLEKGIVVQVGDVASLPYKDSFFDLVYASHVMEHTVMPLVALLEAERVARALVIVTPRWPRMMDQPYHFSVVPGKLWLHWLSLSGWKVGANLSTRRDYGWLCLRDKEDLEKVITLYQKKKWQAKRARRQKRRAQGKSQ